MGSTLSPIIGLAFAAFKDRHPTQSGRPTARTGPATLGSLVSSTWFTPDGFSELDFHGWTAAARDDVKFDLKHFSDIERLALVGDKRWEQGMSVLCRPFTKASIRFFPSGAIQEARTWQARYLTVPGLRRADWSLAIDVPPSHGKIDVEQLLHRAQRREH